MGKLHTLIKIYLLITVLLTVLSLLKIYNYKSWLRENYAVSIGVAKDHPIRMTIDITTRNNKKYKSSSLYEDEFSRWGSSFSSSDAIKYLMLPDSLKLNWVSLRERKIYKGNFKFPAKIIDSIFKYEKDKKKSDLDSYRNTVTYYFDFSIGIAPKGHVTIWLVGKDFQKEIAQFQAEEVPVFEDGDYRFTNDNMDELIEAFTKKPQNERLDSLLINKIPPELAKWDDRIAKFNYYIITKNFPKGITNLTINLFNGEKSIYNITKNNKIKITGNAPSFIKSNYYDEDKEIRISLEDTIITHFKTQRKALQKKDTLVLLLAYKQEMDSVNALLTTIAAMK